VVTRIEAGDEAMAEVGLSADAFPLLTRKDSIQFVRNQLGFPLSPSLFDKKCMRGEGPDIAGYWGKREMYTRQKLKEWALKLFTEHPAHLGSDSHATSIGRD
jgi:hypothetical protein